MKVALLQLDPTVGALASNANRLLSAVDRAARAGAELAVASELVLTGYPPKDLLDRPEFVRDTENAAARVVERMPAGITLIFGSVGRHGVDEKRPLSNEAVVATSGRILTRAVKQLLPTYDVFDEARYFSPGMKDTLVDVNGMRTAVTVCEDAWGESEALSPRYDHNPLDVVQPSQVDLLVNVSASPFTLAKLQDRPSLFSGIARRHGVPVVLVNQVGGNDELLFDGRSTVFDRLGRVTARAKSFEEDVVVVDLPGEGRIEPEPVSNAEAAYLALRLGVRDYARKCGFQRAVIGLSGGIDSAVTAVIAADALGSDRVLGVAMPTRYSSEGAVVDARALAEALGVEWRVIDVDPLFQAYLDHLGPVLNEMSRPGPSDVTFENVQARIRGATLMALSNRTGALVLTTGNKSEVAVGYTTLYGDMVGGLAVISDVPKTMVYEIARYINRGGTRIPQSTIDKPPSAELRPNQRDEDSLPPYAVLDRILELAVEQQLSRREILERGFDAEVVDRTLSLVRASEYKRRQAAPGLIITSKAFGPGRRMPIAQGYGDS
jgi:NAD+ synthase (glutamine-hydrolysing)